MASEKSGAAKIEQLTVLLQRWLERWLESVVEEGIVTEPPDDVQQRWHEQINRDEKQHRQALEALAEIRDADGVGPAGLRDMARRALCVHQWRTYGYPAHDFPRARRCDLCAYTEVYGVFDQDWRPLKVVLMQLGLWPL